MRWNRTSRRRSWKCVAAQSHLRNSCALSVCKQIHHQKHHNAYVTNYNKALEQLEAAQASGDVAQLVSLQSALTFNGGGHVNHALFWHAAALL